MVATEKRYVQADLLALVWAWLLGPVGLGPLRASARAGLRGLSLDQRGTVVSVDIITGIDKDPVGNFDDLYQALDGRKPGEQVTVHYERDGRAMRTSIPLTEIE